MEAANGLKDLSVTLGEMVARGNDMLPAYREISPMLVSDVQENFREGGRPRWIVSRRATKEHGQTLLRTGRLMKSVTDPNVSSAGIVFGSSLPYARIHQEGGEIKFAARSEIFIRNRHVKDETKKGQFRRGSKRGQGFTRKAYTLRMPARPYIAFSEQTVADARQVAVNFLLGR
jgi:phage gpG-like protein